MFIVRVVQKPRLMYAFHLAYRESAVRHAFVMKPHMRLLRMAAEFYNISFYAILLNPRTINPTIIIYQTYFMVQLDWSFCVISNFGMPIPTILTHMCYHFLVAWNIQMKIQFKEKSSHLRQIPEKKSPLMYTIRIHTWWHVGEMQIAMRWKAFWFRITMAKHSIHISFLIGYEIFGAQTKNATSVVILQNGPAEMKAW